MKKWIKLIIMFIISILITYPLNVVVFGMSDITEPFIKSGAEFVRMDITGQSKLTDKNGARSAAINLFKSSGINGNYSIIDQNGVVELDYNGSDMDICIRTRESSEEKLIYASFLVSQYKGTRNINNIRRTVLNAFEFYNVKPSFSSLIQGKYDRKMSIGDMNDKVSEIFLKSGAKVINSINDERLVSTYGFMPGIKDTVKIEGRNVNLNIALRYSSASGCTYIWIANPVIAVEY